MAHFRNKNDILAWLEDNAPRKAIQNAMTGGRVEFLGLFTKISGSFTSGWIVRITSKRGTVWNVAIILYGLKSKYSTFTIKLIPWEKWMGDKIGHPLFLGDSPKEYRKLRDEARTN